MLESTIGTYENVGEFSFVGNYFINYLRNSSKMKSFLPLHVNPERYITISIEGFNECVFAHDNLILNEGMKLIGIQLNGLKKIYGKEYIFTEPQLQIKPNPLIFQLKIGILKRETWKQMKKKSSSILT